jgi:DNA repair exonuclease SbcCD ATPase subunit
MKRTKIDIPLKKIKYIHHISDVHIRNLKRHAEYEQVFERLYEKIKQNREDSIIYIGGDIAHSKTDMSPELVDQTSRFLKSLSEICPTIVITGNHDCNLNNLNRLDVLTPIINNLNLPNLHYLKRSGVYDIADMSFVVWDVWEDEEDYIKASDFEADTKVVLYHGTVDRSKTDVGFSLPGKVTIDYFDGYDLGLIGDIHKRQYLDKEKTIAYCGSLIQQNHGESIGHGYLLWEVETKKSEYIEIPNDYGYYTIDIDKGIVPDVKGMPKKARLRVRVSNTNGIELKKALAIIHHRYGIKDVTITKVDRRDVGNSDSEMVIGDVNDTDYQYELIEDYLKRNHAITDETLVKIKKLNEEINNELPPARVKRNINWKLKHFEFSNMFCYGENNYVDFTQLDGIVGMFAPNASGKSTLLDALSFCLFDITSRTTRAASVLNNRKNNFYCKVNFEVGGLDYFIERKASKRARDGHVKVNVNFWMIDDKGQTISLNGDQRRTTNYNINQVVGTYEDFILSTLSTQNNFTVFIDKTQKERKELLSTFMGTDIFDSLYQSANDKISETQTLLRDFSKVDYSKNLAELQKQTTLLQVKQTDLLSKKEKQVEKQNKLNNKIINLTKKLKVVDDNIQDIDKLESDLLSQSSDFKEVIKDIDKTLSEFNDISNLLDEIETNITQYESDNINEQYSEFQTLQQSRDEFQIEIDKLKVEVRNKLDKTEKLKGVTWDENCEHCMSNPLTIDARETEKNLEKDKELAAAYLEKKNKMDKEIEALNPIIEQKEKYDEYKSSLVEAEFRERELKTNLQYFKERKKNINSSIETIEQDIKQYNEQKSNIKYNKKIKEDIQVVQNDLDDVEDVIVNLTSDITEVHADIKVGDSEMKNINNKIKEIEELENKNQAYRYYLDAVRRDSVPYELLEKAIPTIEGEINNILGQLVDFQMSLEMDGKNINSNIVYDDVNQWPLELSSGMERFISSLAMRVGLINVSNLPRSNFLAIDEGWGTMDSDNINSVYNLFQYLKTQFQFALIVSHVDSMRDAVDTLLEITKDTEYSKIKFD